MRTVSIVIPVRNGERTLTDQLDALVGMARPDLRLEVIIADNGSTDATRAIATAYQERLPIRVLDCGEEPGINIARNRGVAAATGDWLVFCDADDEVDGSWLVHMCQAFEDGHVLVCGVLDYRRLNDPSLRAWRGADRTGVVTVLDFLPSGHGANLGCTRALFDEIGGFDERFRGGGDDIDFVWRAQLAGHALHEVPAAVVHYRLRPSLRDHWRQSIGYGAAEALLYRRFAPAGMRRRSAAGALGDMWWIVTRLPFACTPGRRGAWLRRVAQQVGRFRGAARHRVLWW